MFQFSIQVNFSGACDSPRTVRKRAKSLWGGMDASARMKETA